MDSSSTPKVPKGPKFGSKKKEKGGSKKHNLNEEAMHPQTGSTSSPPEPTEGAPQPETQTFPVTPETPVSDGSKQESQSDMGTESDKQLTSSQSAPLPSARKPKKSKKRGN